MVFFVAQQSHAFGLGEIQVDSYLGEPLKAQVDLIELAADYESNLKVRLASPEEYKKNGYAYPYNIKYKFAVVNDNGKQPRVWISSSQSIEEPYLSLLMEVDSPSGKIIKIFTFLIDPAPDILPAPVAVQPIPLAPATQAEIAANGQGLPAVAVVSPTSDTGGQQRQAGAVKSSNKTHAAAHTRNKKPVSGQHHYVRNPNFGKLSLSLSTSLTISGDAPTSPTGTKDDSDALQEELIAKEKTLGELNAQIAEMKTVIKGLQIKLSLTAESAVGAPDVLAQNRTDVLPVVSAVPAIEHPTKIIAPVVVAEVGSVNTFVNLSKEHVRELLAGLVVVLGGLGFYWLRQRRLESGWIPRGLFDDAHHADSGDAETAPVSVVKAEGDTPAAGTVMTKTVAKGEQTMKVPVFKEHDIQSPLPPEYDLLEEADIYLRFGHDKLAEDVLRDALKINPTNPEIYMTLLGIFETRLDAKGFEKTALQMKPITDAATWKKVAEMGKKLDRSNTLYD